MKKILIAIAALLVLSIAAIYVFIPKKIIVNRAIFVQTSDKYAFKFLSDKSHWQYWWPEYNRHDSVSKFNLNGYHFTIDSVYYHALKISMQKDNERIGSLVRILPINMDSSSVYWECILESGDNPIKRLQEYKEAVELKKTMVTLLDSLKTHLNQQENIYGMRIGYQQIKDTLMLFSKISFHRYPSLQQEDSIFKKLRIHIKKYAALEVGFPMLNVQKENVGYTAQIAMPINKVIPETDDYKIRRIVPLTTLVGEVRGGPYTIQKAFENIDQFRVDHQKVSPVIPFQSLITDRYKQPDTSKWVTKIYCPIL